MLVDGAITSSQLGSLGLSFKPPKKVRKAFSAVAKVVSKAAPILTIASFIPGVGVAVNALTKAGNASKIMKVAKAVKASKAVTAGTLAAKQIKKHLAKRTGAPTSSSSTAGDGVLPVDPEGFLNLPKETRRRFPGSAPPRPIVRPPGSSPSSPPNPFDPADPSDIPLGFRLPRSSPPRGNRLTPPVVSHPPRVAPAPIGFPVDPNSNPSDPITEPDGRTFAFQQAAARVIGGPEALPTNLSPTSANAASSTMPLPDSAQAPEGGSAFPVLPVLIGLGALVLFMGASKRGSR